MTYTPHLLDDNSMERLDIERLSPFERARKEAKPRLLEDLRLSKQVLGIVEKQQPSKKATEWGQSPDYPGKIGSISKIYRPVKADIVTAGEVAGMSAGDELDDFKKFQRELNDDYLQAMLDSEIAEESPSIEVARQAVEEGYSSSYTAPVIIDLSPANYSDVQLSEAA